VSTMVTQWALQSNGNRMKQILDTMVAEHSTRPFGSVIIIW